MGYIHSSIMQSYVNRIYLCVMCTFWTENEHYKKGCALYKGKYGICVCLNHLFAHAQSSQPSGVALYRKIKGQEHLQSGSCSVLRLVFTQLCGHDIIIGKFFFKSTNVIFNHFRFAVHKTFLIAIFALQFLGKLPVLW